jgi:hypothetical protein
MGAKLAKPSRAWRRLSNQCRVCIILLVTLMVATLEACATSLRAEPLLSIAMRSRVGCRRPQSAHVHDPSPSGLALRCNSDHRRYMSMLHEATKFRSFPMARSYLSVKHNVDLSSEVEATRRSKTCFQLFTKAAYPIRRVPRKLNPTCYSIKSPDQPSN